MVARRRAGFDRLAELYRERFPRTRALGGRRERRLSDLAVHHGRYRVPFQFSRLVRGALAAGVVRAVRAGVTVTDLDGNCSTT